MSRTLSVERRDRVMVGDEFRDSKHEGLRFATPVIVRGYQESGAPFEEAAHTVAISPEGGLIKLRTPVRDGQLLLLKHEQTGGEIVCSVAVRGQSTDGTSHAKVAFLDPSPGFWGIDLCGTQIK